MNNIITRKVVAMSTLAALAFTVLTVGCGRTISKSEETHVNRDGTVTKKEKTITENPDGTISKTESRKTDRP